MTGLLLGPMQRHTDSASVTIWVETTAPGLVEVTALDSAAAAASADGSGAARTFTVGGHHYAVVTVGGLRAGVARPYEVRVDGVRVWPLPGEPPSLLRPAPGPADPRPVTLAFGSCRVTAPQDRPYTLNADEHDSGLGTDALHALALDLREHLADPARTGARPVPDVLLLLGDQVYADHVSPETRAWIATRRDTTRPPGEEIADFEEYTRLYREAWSQPEIRWLLSTVPTAMVFDDHDVRDDWNISATWRGEISAMPWWDERITGGIMAAWLYQHLGNLGPAQRAADPLFAALTADGGAPGAAETGADPGAATRTLREFARRADARADGVDHDDIRWSYRWDLGRTRLVVIDSRSARVVTPDGRRVMVADAEWDWVRDQTRQDGDVDHLLLATSLPYLLTPGIHWVEAASEALAAGRRGRFAARQAERLRQRVDLEHWAAFGESFASMAALLRAVASGAHGPAPASVVLLSGDVHHAYLARADLPGARSAVYQAVCSPFRNPLGKGVRRVDRLARTGAVAGAVRALAKLAGAPDPAIDWQVTAGPWFESQIAYLDLAGRAVTLRLDKTEPDGTPGGLDEVLRVALS
ncbi:alkaline phosphatase D family protein [Frankia sp. AgKG'84/4]